MAEHPVVNAAKPFVTCVLIFLNGERFIDEAIRSVVTQAGFDEWELVCVDDGSIDGSSAIALGWAAADPGRIRYIEHPGHENLGMSASRNAGVAIARGTYIGFLDCDDIWLNSTLAHCRRVLAAHPEADVLIGGTWRWWSWTGVDTDKALDQEMSLPPVAWRTTIDPPDLFAAMYDVEEPGAWHVLAMCSLIIRREALIRLGGLDAAFRGLFEDQVLYVKLALNLRAVVDPRPLALYRQHPDSACEVSIAAGEWQRSGPSAPMARYLRWLQEYVAGGWAANATAVALVDRHLRVEDPADVRASLYRSRVPRPLRAMVRRALQAKRQLMNDPAPCAIARWSEQHLGVAISTMDGDVLIVAASRRAGQLWEREVPAFAFAAATHVRSSSWRRAVRQRTRYHHVVVPYAVGRNHEPAAVLDHLGPLVHPHGSLTVLLPGCWVDALLDHVATHMPEWSVDVETFGNAVTAAASPRRQTRRRLGVFVDHHDGITKVIVAATLTAPASIPRRAVES